MPGIILLSSKGKAPGLLRIRLATASLLAMTGEKTFYEAVKNERNQYSSVLDHCQIQLIGVGRTVLLTTTAPLFVLPFSILILKETPMRYTIAGTFFVLLGYAWLSPDYFAS